MNNVMISIQVKSLFIKNNIIKDTNAKNSSKNNNKKILEKSKKLY